MKLTRIHQIGLGSLLLVVGLAAWYSRPTNNSVPPRQKTVASTKAGVTVATLPATGQEAKVQPTAITHQPDVTDQVAAAPPMQPATTTPIAYATTDLRKTMSKKAYKRYMIAERWKSEFDMVKDPKTGTVPKGIHQQGIKAALRTPQFQLKPSALEKAIPSITITSRGPNNYGGRTRALGFDVRNTDIVLSGGVSGGIFRSTDGGASWTRVTPAGEMHSLTAIAQDTRDGHRDTWYAGTGEQGGSAGADNASYYGHGIWKSTDNGLTWTALASTRGSQYEFDNDFDYISRIVVSPNDGSVLVAASETIQRSTDGGNNWSKMLGTATAGLVGDIIYNATGSTFYAAIYGQSIHASTDNGATWTKIATPTTDLATGGVKRIVLANVAATNNILAMYELVTPHNCAAGGTSAVGLKQYAPGSPGTWTDHTEKISNCSQNVVGVSDNPKVISLQDGYNMCVATKPDDGNLIYIGGVEVYRLNLASTPTANEYRYIGGSQKSSNTVNLHVDNHLLLFVPGSNTMLWAANDGGLRRTDVTGTITDVASPNHHDNGFAWTDRTSGYTTHQYYDADINPTNGSTFVAGAAQDNAFTIQPTDGTAKEVGPTADGTTIGIISGTDMTTYSMIIGWQEGGLARIENGNEIYIKPAGAAQGFHSIIYLDADNTNYLYYPSTTPSKGLYRTRVASGIANGTISGNPSTNWELLTGVQNTLTGEISAMETSRNESFSGNTYSASNTNRKMYIGTKDGKVYRLADPAFGAAATTPTNITPGTATGYVSDIAVNPYDDKEIIVTYSNYNTVGVWHTSDATASTVTWTAIEGTSTDAVALSSVRSAMILKANGTTYYFVGTSVGLYGVDVLNGTSTSWTRVGTTSNIGLSVCSEMRLRTSDNKMVLGTHGNGLFMLEFPVALPVELVAFAGKATEEGNLLTWETASELNNMGFDVEKSADAVRFEKIGFVAGNGTTLETQSYTFLDPNIVTGTSYYRLKQQDIDGAAEYSKTISITAKQSFANQEIRLYPNPVQNYLVIENAIGTITITSISGQVIAQVQNDASRYELDVRDLPQGTYVVRLQKGSSEIITRQFIK